MLLIKHPEDLYYRNGVPVVVWCYWEGPPMTGNRLLSFTYLTQNIGVPVCLVTPENISVFLKDTHPLPSAYPDLSVVHRSDYIRAYLLHHYGGGWHDIKATEVSYAKVWEEFENDAIWIIGRPENQNGAANVYNKEGQYLPDYYKQLIAVPSWVGRPNTPLSKDILLGIESLINAHRKTLAVNPSKHPRDKKIIDGPLLKRLFQRAKFAYQGRSTSYPLEWTLFGNVFHPCILLYQDHVSRTLPVDMIKNAGIYHRG